MDEIPVFLPPQGLYLFRFGPYGSPEGGWVVAGEKLSAKEGYNTYIRFGAASMAGQNVCFENSFDVNLQTPGAIVTTTHPLSPLFPKHFRHRRMDFDPAAPPLDAAGFRASRGYAFEHLADLHQLFLRVDLADLDLAVAFFASRSEEHLRHIVQAVVRLPAAALPSSPLLRTHYAVALEEGPVGVVQATFLRKDVWQKSWARLRRVEGSSICGSIAVPRAPGADSASTLVHVLAEEGGAGRGVTPWPEALVTAYVKQEVPGVSLDCRPWVLLMWKALVLHKRGGVYMHPRYQILRKDLLLFCCAHSVAPLATNASFGDHILISPADSDLTRALVAHVKGLSSEPAESPRLSLASALAEILGKPDGPTEVRGVQIPPPSLFYPKGSDVRAHIALGSLGMSS